MEPVDFYALPRAAQERFVGSVKGSGLPAPILRTLTKPLEPWAWIGASAASLVLVVVLCRAGYGDLTRGFAVQGIGWLVAYVALFGLFVFGGLRALGVLREHRASPYPRGVYLFPVGIITARSSVLEVYPIEDLVNVGGPDLKGRRGFVLDFGGKSFEFAVKDEALAETAGREIASARGTMKEARGSRDSIRPKALAAVDPLQGYTNPLGASERMARTAPLWAKLDWGVAVLAGAVLGVTVWAVRNARSDEAMYQQAIAANDTATLSAYLARGSRHKAEVGDVLLPRAELLLAEQSGTVEAIAQFAATHPESSIAPELAAALRAALLSELDIAVKVGTLSAIDEFTRRFPEAHLEPEVLRARHGVYEAAFNRYLSVAPPKARAEGAFVQALLAWAETKGAPVEIRVIRQKSSSLDKADSAVAKSRMFRGVVSLPSHYFDGDGEKPYEDALVAAIVRRFSSVFSEEILAFRPGGPIAGSDPPLTAKILVPSLFIEHGASWHGAVLSAKSAHGVFSALELSFDALFRVPDATKPVRVTFDAWRLPDLAAAAGADSPEEVVYGEMHQKAFDLFQKKLLGAFFEPEK